MPDQTPPTVGLVRLDQRAAARLWDWTLRRQGLISATRRDSVSAVASGSLGLHAARVPSPFATVLARATNPSVAMSLFTPGTHQHIITIRCMRKTLHMLPLGLATAAHCATRHYRERDARRLIANAQLDMNLIGTTTQQIIGLLDGGGRDYREIEQTLNSAKVPVIAIRLAIKLAWEQGLLSYRNSASGWNRERRTFSLTAQAFPDLDMALDRQLATTQLMHAYFDIYGPATVQDAMWWSGLSRTAIVAATRDLGRPLLVARTPWSTSDAYMYQHRYEEFSEVDGHAPLSGVNFLAHEDVALKAYFETRTRYLEAVDGQSAFNRIGEALPTIVIDGQVHGVWAWQPKDRRVVYTLHARQPAPNILAQLRSEAWELTDALRQGYTDEPIRTSQNPNPDQLALFPEFTNRGS